MARRKRAAVTEDQTAVIEEAPPQEAETATAVLEPPRDEQPPRPRLVDPFPFKTVNMGGTKVHFQHSRQAGESHIRFGDGSRNDMPPEAIREFIKSHKGRASDGSGEKSLFDWNENDRAWGMRIDREDPETSRQTAKNIFDEVVGRMAGERGTASDRSR